MSESLENIDSKYFCMSCKKLNTEPFQSSCGCRYCFNCIENLKECGSCNVTIETYLKDKAFKKEIEMKTLKCVLCEWNGKIVDYNTHYNEQHSQKKCKICDIEVEDFVKHSIEYAGKHCEMMADLYNQFKQIKEEKNGGNDGKILDDIVTIVRKDSMNLLKQIESYQSHCEKLDSQLKQVQKALLLQQASIVGIEERLIQTANTCKSGEFLWKITNVKDKFLEAKAGRQTSIYSMPFYTSEYGYKLCARVFLNGDGQAKGTHVSIFVSIMRGPNDNLLEWPFKQKISFVLIDQGTKETKENLCDCFRPDPKSAAFQKPTNEINTAAGIPKFFPLAKLFSNENEYIKDDSLFIKIMVSNTGFN